SPMRPCINAMRSSLGYGRTCCAICRCRWTSNIPCSSATTSAKGRDMSRADSATPLLQARSIGKYFGNITALHDVSFDVLPGEVHALVGENGAGKSTLLAIVNGLLKPDHGALWLCGQPARLAG